MHLVEGLRLKSRISLEDRALLLLVAALKLGGGLVGLHLSSLEVVRSILKSLVLRGAKVGALAMGMVIGLGVEDAAEQVGMVEP